MKSFSDFWLKKLFKINKTMRLEILVFLVRSDDELKKVVQIWRFRVNDEEELKKMKRNLEMNLKWKWKDKDEMERLKKQKFGWVGQELSKEWHQKRYCAWTGTEFTVKRLCFEIRLCYHIESTFFHVRNKTNIDEESYL